MNQQLVDALRGLSKEEILKALSAAGNQNVSTGSNNIKFDLKTHHFDPKGKLIKKNPYRLHVVRGEKLFERPIGSGNLFHANNEPAGRVTYDISDDGLKKSKKIDRKAEHIAFKPAPTGAELVAMENEKLKSQNEILLKELASIRGEQVGEMQAQPQKEAAESNEAQKTDANVAEKTQAASQPAKQAEAVPKPESTSTQPVAAPAQAKVSAADMLNKAKEKK